MQARILIIVVFVMLMTGCSQNTQTGNPTWVDQLIEKYKSDPVGNPPQSIWSYEYSGQAVYFIPAQCCDMYSTLYDVGGNVLCAPDGGFTGKGDGKCSDFFDMRTKEQLIWQDARTR